MNVVLYNIVVHFLCRNVICFFRLGVKRPAAQPEEFRGRGRGFTPLRYICDIYL